MEKKLVSLFLEMIFSAVSITQGTVHEKPGWDGSAMGTTI